MVRYIALLEPCGGHTREYHFHERLSCLYNMTTAGHSAQVGEEHTGLPGGTQYKLYGKYEKYQSNATFELPKLDACGAHFGVTPDSNGATVYHYHVQDSPPFMFGCFGPDYDPETGDEMLVTLEKCRSLYDGCDNPAERRNLTIESLPGKRGNIKSIEYDLWCSCYDGEGSNIGIGTQLAAFLHQEGTNGSSVVTNVTLAGSHQNTTGGGLHPTTSTSTSTMGTPTTTIAGGAAALAAALAEARAWEAQAPELREVRIPCSIPMTLTPAQQSAFLASDAVMRGVKTAAEAFFLQNVVGTGVNPVRDGRNTEVLNASFAKAPSPRVLLAVLSSTAPRGPSIGGESRPSRALQQESVIFGADVKVTVRASDAAGRQSAEAAADSAASAIESQAKAADQTAFQTALVTKIAEQVASAATGDPILALPGPQRFTSATLGQAIGVPTPAVSVQIVTVTTTAPPTSKASFGTSLTLEVGILLLGWILTAGGGFFLASW